MNKNSFFRAFRLQVPQDHFNPHMNVSILPKLSLVILIILSFIFLKAVIQAIKKPLDARLAQELKLMEEEIETLPFLKK